MSICIVSLDDSDAHHYIGGNLYLRLRKMSHTIYAANGKVSHIHRRMCEWDDTIDKSVCKAKEDVMLEYVLNLRYNDEHHCITTFQSKYTTVFVLLDI
jgi:hypothetical protein